MRKLLSLTAALLASLALAGCSAAGKAALPPQRIGNRGMVVNLEALYSPETAAAEADLVALVRVGDWVKEDSYAHVTYYNAKILRTFKGSAGETITLIQDGFSQMTVDGYPLFISGNEMLLFLVKSDTEEFDNAYWELGSFSTVIDAVRDREGELFYLDRFGLMGSALKDCKNYLFDETKFAELKEIAVKADPEAAKYRYHYIFSAAEADPLLEAMTAGE